MALLKVIAALSWQELFYLVLSEKLFAYVLPNKAFAELTFFPNSPSCVISAVCLKARSIRANWAALSWDCMQHIKTMKFTQLSADEFLKNVKTYYKG